MEYGSTPFKTLPLIVFSGVADELKGLFREFQPILCPMFRVSQLFLELGEFGLELGFLAQVLLVVDQITEAHLCESVDFVLGGEHGFGLHLVNLAALLDFAVVVLIQHLNRPVFELGKDGVARHFRLHCLLEFDLFNGPLLAVRLLLVMGAMVESVFLDFARALDGFLFGLSGYGSTTLTTSQEGLEAKVIFLGSRVALLPEQSLNPVVFFQRDHRLVSAFLPCAILMFYQARIERIGEHLINATSALRLTTHFLGLWSSVSPFVIEFFKDLWRSSVPREHQIPALTENWEPLLIDADRFHSLGADVVIQPALCRSIGTNAHLEFVS